MPISPIHHVALTVSDLERSVAFYCDVLGFRKTLDMTLSGPGIERLARLRPGSKMRSVILQQGRATVGELELIAVEPPPPDPDRPKRAGELGVFLISFEVTDEEMTEVYRRLQGKGVRCFSEPQTLELRGYGPIEAVIFEDPDGNLLELFKSPAPEVVRQHWEAVRAERAGRG